MTTMEILGAAMLAVPFLVMFVAVSRMEGLRVAVGIFSALLGLIAWLSIGVTLLKGVI